MHEPKEIQGMGGEGGFISKYDGRKNLQRKHRVIGDKLSAHEAESGSSPKPLILCAFHSEPGIGMTVLCMSM